MIDLARQGIQAKSDVMQELINTQKGILEDSFTEYEKQIKEQAKDREGVWIETLQMVNDESAVIAYTLAQTTGKVGYTISKEITSAWTGSGKAMSDYAGIFTNSSASSLTILQSLKLAKRENEGIKVGNGITNKNKRSSFCLLISTTLAFYTLITVRFKNTIVNRMKHSLKAFLLFHPDSSL